MYIISVIIYYNMLNTPKPRSKTLLVIQNKSKIFTKFLKSVK